MKYMIVIKRKHGKIVEKLKGYLYFLVCEKNPYIEYIVGGIKSYTDIQEIESKCSWTFLPEEKIKLFFLRLGGAVLCIIITGFVWNVFKPAIIQSFNVTDLPRWTMLPFLYATMESVTKVLDDMGIHV